MCVCCMRVVEVRVCVIAYDVGKHGTGKAALWPGNTLWYQLQ